MAYGTKFRFRFESVNGTVYEVRLRENGYSGSVTDRPLGKAPVIRMQEADPFRPTSCDLVLECRTDGEYVDLYTTDPLQYKVEIYQKSGSSSFNIIWEGFVATEIYSEPDIAPPYDVRITATDGLGILKEFPFEPTGPNTLFKEHLFNMLSHTGLADSWIYSATNLREYGDTTVNFMDNAMIDLDFMEGKNCYEVLGELLTSMRCIITRRVGHWLIVRAVDAQINSNGMLSVVGTDYHSGESSSTDTNREGSNITSMNGSGLWPVGYLTRRVVPAKKAVTVMAPWNWKNGFPSVTDNDWTLNGAVSYNSTYKLYRYTAPNQSTAQGSAGHTIVLATFTTGFKVKVKASVYSPYSSGSAHNIQVKVTWMVGSTYYYYAPSTGWTTTSNQYSLSKDVSNSNPDYDPNEAEELVFEIPSMLDSNAGFFSVSIRGMYVDVYDIQVIPDTVAGYKDIITIDNGARGEAPAISLAVCRAIQGNFLRLNFTRGLFWTQTTSGGATVDHPITAFSDGSNTNKDFMSLNALAYAKEYAAPRIEITGTLHNIFVSAMRLPPMFLKSHGVWAMVESYDWDMKEENITFKAVTLPTATLTVSSENISTVPNN